MFGLRPAALLLTLVLAAPGAAAWTLGLPASPTAPSHGPQASADAAWTSGMARPLPSGLPGAATGAAACALGDANADGVGDLVLQVKDAATGGARLSALAGPAFTTQIWTSLSSAPRLLECAPDLGLDHVADPVVRTLGQATGAAGGAAASASASAQQVLQTLDGATGLPLVGRTHLDSRTGVADAGGAASAAQTAAAALLPAAAGAEAFVQTTVKQAGLLLPVDALPVGALTSTVEATARLDVLDSAGAVVASVAVGQAGELPLALAPLPLSGRLPDVAALTLQAASPVQQVAGGIPKLALYGADGALAWSVSLAASTGVPVLVPRAGDLNLDGVQDLIVETVQQGVGTAPGAAFQVLSGLDGATLLSSGSPVDGVLAAVPFGQLPVGPALLKVQRLAGEATTSLSAVGATGRALWTTQIDALAQPANQVLDAYTGDVLGFTDLTGDAVPDVGVAVAQGASLALKAIDGATGKVAWSATLPDAASVLPIALGTAHGLVAQATAGASAALLAVGGTAAPVLTLVDAATGQVAWTARAAARAGEPLNVSVQAAGDLDGDGVQDLLATATGAAGQAAAVVALSGATGKMLLSTVTDATDLSAALAFTAQPGPAFHAASAGAQPVAVKASAPPLAPLLAAVLLAALAAGRRPARRQP
jgi:hypothetical protein